MTPMRDKRVLVFIPTFNDFECLPEIVRGILRLSPDFRCLILDDGSNPPLAARDFKGSALVYRLPDNMGIGVCTQIAFDHALRHGYKAVVRIDADGQHPVERARDLIAVMESEGADVVAGSRINRLDNKMFDEFLRRLVRRYFALVTRMLTRGNCPRDVNTGFFAINRRGVQALDNYRLDRFPEPELYILSARLGMTVREIDVVQRERRHGASTLNVLAATRMVIRFTLFAIDELFRSKR